MGRTKGRNRASSQVERARLLAAAESESGM